MKWISSESSQETIESLIEASKGNQNLECAPSPFFVSKPLLQSPMASSMVLRNSYTPPRKLSETMNVEAFIEDRKAKHDFTKSAFFPVAKEDYEAKENLQVKPESFPSSLPLHEEFEPESSIILKKNSTKKFYPDLAEKQKV